MIDKFEAQNIDDENGNPAGGLVKGTGLSIEWQSGPLQVDGVRQEPNGAFVETVLEAVRQRIESFQLSKFACEENAKAITHIEDALKALNERTSRRTAEGTEGTHKV